MKLSKEILSSLIEYSSSISSKVDSFDISNTLMSNIKIIFTDVNDGKKANKFKHDGARFVSILSSPSSCKFKFIDISLQRLYAICHKVLLFPSHNLNKFGGPRTAIIIGGVGEGKSNLLEILHDMVYTNFITKYNKQPLILKLSIRALLNSNQDLRNEKLNQYKGMRLSLDNEEDEVEYFWRILKIFCSFFSSNIFNEMILEPFDINIQRETPLLILCDDIDEILNAEKSMSLSPGSVTDSESLEYSLNPQDQEQMCLIAICLKKLLGVLTSAHCRLQIVFIASTSIPKHRISGSLLGPPGFEIWLQLPHLDFRDRIEVFYALLSTNPPFGLCRDVCLGLIDEDHSIGNDAANKERGSGGESRRLRWARRLAQLTPGYAVGDLKAIVKMALLINAGHEGEHRNTPISQQSLSLEDGSKSVTLPWKEAIQAVGMVSPAPLKGMELGSVSQSHVLDGKRRLGWGDFAGYASVKDIIQRLLKRICLSQQDEGASKSRKNLFVAGSGVGEVRGIVIHGPSGCGKTYLARIIAAEVKNPLQCVMYA